MFITFKLETNFQRQLLWCNWTILICFNYFFIGRQTGDCAPAPGHAVSLLAGITSFLSFFKVSMSCRFECNTQLLPTPHRTVCIPRLAKPYFIVNANTLAEVVEREATFGTFQLNCADKKSTALASWGLSGKCMSCLIGGCKEVKNINKICEWCQLPSHLGLKSLGGIGK